MFVSSYSCSYTLLVILICGFDEDFCDDGSLLEEFLFLALFFLLFFFKLTSPLLSSLA